MGATNTERLEKLVGFDPAKSAPATKELLQEVLADIHKERATKAKEAALVQLREAFQLRQDMHKLQSEFNKQLRKFDEKLGKIVSSLEHGLRGTTPPPAPETPTEGGESEPG